MKILLGSLIVALALLAVPKLAQANTLDSVKARGTLNCGVNIGLAGFSLPDSKGIWRGLDADFCRAIAAAVLGDADKVKFVALTSQNRFTALQSGEIDVLIRNTTQTFQRDTGLGLRNAGVNFYDGQGFATKKSSGTKAIADLNGATVCMLQGSTHELNIADWFREHGLTFHAVVVETPDQMMAAFQSGRCDAITQDGSNLASLGAFSVTNKDDYLVLPGRISKEPLGPMVRRGDEEWQAIVRWTLMAVIEGEELGITQANVDKMLADSASPNVQRLLGKSGEFGKLIGLDNAWAMNVLKQVGNYGEIYERNVGTGRALNLPRGTNDLWTRGGLMYAVPFR
jgi:general L-amino acid transport system substrate-binding protein